MKYLKQEWWTFIAVEKFPLKPLVFLGYHVDALIGAFLTIGPFKEVVRPICNSCKLDR